MKIDIARNIKTFRKQRKFTQEQLAEALGVTVGAVSKWESGSSVPEITLIVEMADFFETSVDVLLGYDWRAGGMGQAVERIRSLRNNKDFDDACVEAEKALQKYPNCFDVVFQSALLYSMKGIERHSMSSYRHSLDLFDRSLELIGQNTNDRINEWSIRNNIAEINLRLGRTEEALEQLKSNNAEGLNSGSIGATLAIVEHKPDEALPYLWEAFLDGMTRLFRVTIAYSNAYCAKNDYASAIGALLWMRNAVNGLKLPDTVSYLDREEAQLLSGCAVIAAQSGDGEAAKRYLTEAFEAATRFDSAPEYAFSNTRFAYGNAGGTAFDDFGNSAKDGIRNTLIENSEVSVELLELWQQLDSASQNEKNNKFQKDIEV